jgi:hypothetical protein
VWHAAFVTHSANCDCPRLIAWPAIVGAELIDRLIIRLPVKSESVGMASSVCTPAPEVLPSLPEAQRLIEQLRAQLAEEFATRARLERKLAELDVPIQHVGDSFQFLSDAFEEISQVFHGYRDALISLRTTHTPAAAQLADLRAMESICDLEFLEREVPKVCARSRHEAVQAAELVRTMKEFAHMARPEQKPVRG